jgi:hypothetical protein
LRAAPPLGGGQGDHLGVLRRLAVFEGRRRRNGLGSAWCATIASQERPMPILKPRRSVYLSGIARPGMEFLLDGATRAIEALDDRPLDRE